MVKHRHALVVTVLAAACSFPETPVPQQAHPVVIHAVLDPSQLIQVVDVGVADGGSVADLGRFFGASVTLTGPDGVVTRAKEDTLFVGYSLGYSDPSTRISRPRFLFQLSEANGGLQRGGQYTLRIISAADTIVGTTTIPSAPLDSTSPATVLDRSKDTVSLNWDLVSDAAGYQVQIFTGATHAHTLHYTAMAKPPLSYAGNASYADEKLFPPGDSIQVVVLAVDRNYYDFYRTVAGPFANGAQ
jgi:hypothetical protein